MQELAGDAITLDVGEMKLDYFKALKEKDGQICLSKPQMFSASIRKLMALTEELWQLDFDVVAYFVTNKKPFKNIKEQAQSCFILVLEGSCQFKETKME